MRISSLNGSRTRGGKERTEGQAEAGGDNLPPHSPAPIPFSQLELLLYILYFIDFHWDTQIFDPSYDIIRFLLL